MHYAKYGKAAVGSILMHSDRGIGSPDTREHSNENIDRSRTHLNYDLKERGGQTAYAYYKQRIDQIAADTKERTGKSIRKDAVTLCSWVVTAPKDLPEDKQADFFKAVYDWFSGRYGADNIVTAAVHLDETSPHMHLQFTPIIEKDGVRKLCAKDMETRRTLATAHQKLQKHLEQVLGCEVNILNGATEQGNKSVLELQNETLKQQLAEKEEKVRQAEKRVEQAEKRAKSAEQRLKAVNAQYDVAAEELKVVLDAKARASEIRRSIFDRDTQSYHASMLESTRAIGHEAFEHMQQSKKDRQEVVILKQEIERKEQAVEPLYRSAKAAYNQADKERKEVERFRKEQEKLIEEKAEQKAEEKINQILQGTSSRQIDRMWDYMDNIEFSDGSTASERFEEQEEQLRKKLHRGFER